MEIFCPKYYNNFACLASNCPDSCCKDWSVDVDPEATALYQQMPGALGDRLRQVLIDTEFGSEMQLENGRCPMWQQDGLCRIQAEQGHDVLCKTCREFPRIRHDYGSFVEQGLELSCPEAARLILNQQHHLWIKTSLGDLREEDYDCQAMETLLRTRRDFLSFLEVSSLSCPQILTVLLLYGYDVQEELDGGVAAKLDPERCLADAKKFPATGNFSSLQEFYLALEILTSRWKDYLETPSATLLWDARHKALLGYFICRYWLQAISDFDIVCRIKFIIAACVLISGLGGQMAETAQLFSKEIENDLDNIEAILDGAYTAQALTDLNLLGLLNVSASL